MLIGESASGGDVNAAHTTTVLGSREGPVGIAWATALATPTAGHVPFVVALRPDTAVKPFTLFVTKAAPESPTHRALLRGAAQAGVAAGVSDAVATAVLRPEQCEQDVVIAAVWVHPDADDADEVYRNNRAATVQALRTSVLDLPTPEQIERAARHVVNGSCSAPDRPSSETGSPGRHARAGGEPGLPGPGPPGRAGTNR